jgi:hypothetical protein
MIRLVALQRYTGVRFSKIVSMSIYLSKKYNDNYPGNIDYLGIFINFQDLE